MKIRELKYGESPLDSMSELEVRLFAKRAFSAMVSAESTLRLVRGPETDDRTFWGPEGTGGRALAKTAFTLRTAHPNPGGEDVWRSYYRPATPSLFKDCILSDGRPLEAPWMLCTNSACGVFSSGARGESPATACPCCGSPVREMNLLDVEGLHREGAPA